MVLIIANAIGGLTAIAVYIMLVGVPQLTFLLVCIFLVSLLYGSKIFSSDPRAAVYSTAFTAVLLLVGNSIGEHSADATANFLSRIFQIMGAGLYIILAFYTLTRLFNLRQTKNSNRLPASESGLVSDIG